MIKPTIGRVVLVHRGSSYATPEPALVCFVHSDRLINVGAFDHEGKPFFACSLKLLQDDELVPTDGSWWAEWMPYQKAVAAGAQEPLQHAK